MRISRRDFMKSGLAGFGVFSTASVVPNWIAKSAHAIQDHSGEDRLLVIIQLEGGNDSLNTLVPYEDALYYNARPNLSIAANQVLPIDDLNGFNPNLPDFLTWFNEGKMAIIQNVGYPNPDLSHFISTAYWEEGTIPGGPNYNDIGWMGRAFDEDCGGDPNVSPITMVGAGHNRVPGSLLASTYTAPAIADVNSYQIKGMSDPNPAIDPIRNAFSAQRLASIHALNDIATIDPRIDFIQRTENIAEASISIVQNLPSSFTPPPPRAYPTQPNGRNLGDHLQLCAKLILSGHHPRVLHVRQGGYDTHANQNIDHPPLLQELNDALDAFLQHMEAAGVLDRILVMTFSEFGRRVGDNDSNGTDHGAGSLLFVCGGRVQGGIYGGQPDLQNLQNGNLLHVYDFRNVYADILEDWFYINPVQVFGQDWNNIGFLTGVNSMNSARHWKAYR